MNKIAEFIDRALFGNYNDQPLKYPFLYTGAMFFVRGSVLILAICFFTYIVNILYKYTPDFVLPMFIAFAIIMIAGFIYSIFVD